MLKLSEYELNRELAKPLQNTISKQQLGDTPKEGS
jgi:hypothetical protein